MDRSLISKITASRYITGMAYACYGLLIVAVTLFIFLTVNRVTVRSEGKITTYYTFAPKVADVIRELGIEADSLLREIANLKPGDTVEYRTLSKDLSAKVTNGMNIQIFWNRIQLVQENKIIMPPERRQWDIFLQPDAERVINPGKAGLLQNTFLIKWCDGQLVSREKINTELLAEVKPKVIATGSYDVVSRQAKVPGGRPLKFTATAYTHTGYRTAVGAKTRYGIVAVDPRIIPLGTKMFIEGYGYGVAADTGGAIKGKKLDVFFNSQGEALKWGRKKVNVYILQ